MAKLLVSIGECMVEMAGLGDGRFRRGFAGDTFNAAWHARQGLGEDWRVGYFTALGDDSLSGHMRAFMEAEGIETPHIPVLPGRRPGLYLIELDEGERSFIYWRDTAAARSMADDPAPMEAAIAEADAIYFSGITLAILPVEGRAALLSALGAARRRGAMVAFDSNLRPALWPDAAAMRAAVMAAARVSSLALPTVPDEAALFEEPGAEAVAQRYRDAGVAEVVVRAGTEPALCLWPEGEAWVPPMADVEVVDTTGAGDSFAGAYLAARLQGEAPEAAAGAAHACAARVIGVPGALT